MKQESSVMNYFRTISAIPRASFNEKGMCEYLLGFAKEQGLKAISDDMFNVIIFKEASSGYENAPTVMLQSHTDMVAEKERDCAHNFDTDPLDLYIEDGWLKAKGTTLGADDGAGVAYMLAILADKEAKHPALECVFTVQEETGLTGAEKIDVSMLKARHIIGLDSSGENEIYVSSCGGVRVGITRPVAFESQSMDTVTVKISGLLGGHSGVEIDQERANASKLAGIILYRAQQVMDLRLVAIEGGEKMNAITRENDFTIAVKDVEAFKSWFVGIEKELKLHFEHSDAGLQFDLETGKTDKVLEAEASKAIIDALFMLPYGLIHMSKAIEGLPITSSNIGMVKLNETTFEVAMSVRATQQFIKENVMEQVAWIAAKNGMTTEFTSNYPGWMFEKDSQFRALAENVYQELRQETFSIEATHGGMELGIWSAKLPGSDIISFGPIMHDIHTPQERLDIASFERTYEYMVVLLEAMNQL